MLTTEPQLTQPDEFYEALIGAHRGLTDTQSALLNAKLILLLANQVGDHDTLLAAVAEARAGITPADDQGYDASVKET